MKVYSADSDFDVKVAKSLNLLTSYVLATYGPFGKNILLTKDGTTLLTKDGVTVAKSITSKDKTENAILDIMKQVADKTVKDAGDGTTTSILFLKHFVEKIKATITAFPFIPSTKIREVFEEELKIFLRELENFSTDVNSKELLTHVAFMASNGDKLIADLVATLIDQVGATGSVSIKNSKTGKTYIDIVEGLKFKSAVASASFLDDLQEKKILTDCVIVVSNTTINLSDDLINLLRDCVENKKSLLFVCPNMDEKALLTIITNVQMKRGLQCCVVSPSYLGIEKLEVFEDVALIANTSVNTVQTLTRTKVSEWGYAKTVEVTRGSTILIDAAAKPEILDKAIEGLRGRLQAEEDDATSKRLASRIDRLTSTLGILNIGGATDAEIIEKHHRVEDAIESCHSAMRKGVVPGGGSSLSHLAVIFSSNTGDALVDYVRNVIRFVCKQPAALLYNGNNEFVQTENLKIKKVLDLRSNSFVDPIENGLVEAVWTIQSAMYNAFSSAWLLCQSYGSVIEE